MKLSVLLVAGGLLLAPACTRGAPGDLPPEKEEDAAGSPGSPSTAPADSAGAEPVREPFLPDARAGALASFRIERSVDVERIPFGGPDDPVEPLGLETLADLLRLSPAVRTRELSQGPTVEAFGLRGGGSGRAGLVLGSRSLVLPGTSGPHAHEVMLSEIAGAAVLRGGGAALYGPGAVSGAVVLEPRFPVPDELLSRAFAEEGVDGYQRAGFQVENRLGADAAFFLSSESRRVDGFFPGTKEVDRHFVGRIRGRLPGGLEAELAYRRYEGDGRSGGFDPGTIRPVLTNRDDYRVGLFRPAGEGRGALLELELLREQLENVLATGTVTREITSPLVRVTSDLPSWRGWDLVARMEGIRWRIARIQERTVDEFWRGGAAMRATRRLGVGTLFTGTVRLDGEQGRRRAVQARLEAEWIPEWVGLFAVVSRNERIPERGAVGSANEVHRSAELGVRFRFAKANVRAVLFGTRIDDLRADPTFEQVRARDAELSPPVGDAEIVGATLGLTTRPFPVPRLGFLGSLLLRTSFTALSAEEAASGERLPDRPRRTWTGEGFLERRLFQGELLARLRGRLTHRGDRVGTDGEPVVDLWLTDVLLEGEIGDAVFFYRFHDLLERADEVEPGIRFPGFSRTYGISWRFRG